MSTEDKTKRTIPTDKMDEIKPVDTESNTKIPKCPSLPPSNTFYKVFIIKFIKYYSIVYNMVIIQDLYCKPLE